MKILVTGDQGFVGRHLMDALDDSNHEFIGIDRKTGVNISIRSEIYKELLSKDFFPDLIVHLAASCSTPLSIKNPKQDFQDNVVGTFEICNLARACNSKLIFTSSCKAFTGTPYGTSKAVGEMYVREYGDTFDLKYVINRPGTIYGPGQDGSEESGWLGWFIKASITNQPITIYGDGTQSRDVLHVRDYVSLLMRQIDDFERYSGKVYKVGGGKENELSLLQTLDLLMYPNFKHEKPRKGDVKRFVANNSVPKWSPKIGYKEGIQETIKYYKEILT